MKNIKIILTAITLAIIFNCSEVFAISGSYSYDGINYSVKKIHLDVYKSKLDDNNKLYTIELPDSFTINPQYTDKEKNDEIEHSKETIVNLGLNTTKDEILSLLKTKVTTLDADNHYFIRMIVDFSIDSVPSNLEYLYQWVYNDTDNGFVFSSDSNENSISLSKMTLGQTYSEVFSNFEYKLDNGVELINYSNTYTDDIPVYLDFLLNNTRYSSLDEERQQILAYPGVEIEADPGVIVAYEKYYRILSFIGYDNVEPVYEQFAKDLAQDIDSALKETYKGQSETKSPTKMAQTVNVPNTSKNKGIINCLIGLLIIVIGSIIIIITLKKIEKAL